LGMLLMLLCGLATTEAIAAEKESFVYKNVGQIALKILVSKPDDWKPTDRRPAVAFLHGGGWVGGKPGQFDEHCEHLTQRGMVCFQIQYRLLSKKKPPMPPTQCIQDAKSAMRWIRSHADQFGIDSSRIASGGGSAGGHLAAFLGTTDGTDDPQDDLQVSARANAMLLFNPVYNNGPNKSGLKAWGTARVGDRYEEFSPAHNISSDDAPSIVFLGTQDNLIPTGIAQEFQANMLRENVRSDLRLYEGAGHGFFNHSKDGGKWFKLTINETDEFLVSLGWIPPR
jgi:acetyl esterase